jgi:hypothetical protein
LAALARKVNLEVQRDHDHDYWEHGCGRSPFASLPAPDKCKERRDTAHLDYIGPGLLNIEILARIKFLRLYL